ncbi:MAG: 3-deoxy-8-phosphooctulonate synthase, partial [Nitrospirae bacterium]
IFKSSYDKANRTSITSYRGPGIKEGLKVLKTVKEETALPILSDIHLPQEASIAAEVLDVIQIPAFLCRQTDLLTAAADTGKIVNIKKGQFLSPYDIKYAIDKILSRGNENIMVTERGVCFGYNNLVVDMRSIPIMKSFGFPVVFDATHSVQLPGGEKGCSGGERRFVPTLAKAAVAANCDGIFMEVHEEPDRALCDGPNMLPIEELPELLRKLKMIHSIVKDG